jgi:hypothetical protein
VNCLTFYHHIALVVLSIERMQNPRNFLSTGKEMKARRVFGEAVAEDLDSSLSYSPSPQKNAAIKAVPESSYETNESDVSSNKEKESRYSDPCHNAPITEKENSASISLHNTSQYKVTPQQIRNVPMFSRSPLRPDLVKKTQEAINKATASINNVNQSVFAARQAKNDSLYQKRKHVSKIRQKWKEDTTEAKTLSEMAEKNRRDFLMLQRQLSSKYSKEKARREQEQRQKMLKLIEMEIHFKSDVFCDHKNKLKTKEDDRRRHSAVARAKIRSNNLLGEQKLKLEQIKEEEAIFDERHATSIAIRDSLQRNATQRRKSFAFRNGDARRIRLLHAIMEKERLKQEHNSFELKWQAEKDVENYNREEALARRDSLARRNVLSRKQREVEIESKQKTLTAEHESYELKWDAEKDADAQIRKEQEERRLSLVQRNIDAKCQRDFMQNQRTDMLRKEHESFELNWAGERDAEAYRRDLENARRESLASRNKEGQRQRHFAQQEHITMIHQQHASYELKWAGDKDAETYQRRMEAERRESFAQRNLEARRIRHVTQQNAAVALKQEQASFELERAAAKDVEEYLQQQEKSKRESLQFRNRERAQHAKVLEELRMLSIEKQAESYFLKWASENDVKAHITKLEAERRNSLKLRGQQIIHQRRVENDQRQKTLVKLHEDEALRAVDQRQIDMYTKQYAERDRSSFEYRRKDARIQRVQDEECSKQTREIEDRNVKMEAMARRDVEAYVNDCKQRRRMSLACRAKEKRNHSKWLREQQEQEQDMISRRVHDQLMDQRYVELARQKERARLALDAIRHSGYSFNPYFASAL